jgi:hypothetical protein
MTKLRFVPIPLALLGALACASVPPPTDSVRAAEKAIEVATQADAEPHARLELHLAREHVTEARAMMEDERYVEARQLAEKAQVEAELAEAKARSVRARRNVEEIQEHIATLRREIDRTPEVSR